MLQLCVVSSPGGFPPSTRRRYDHTGMCRGIEASLRLIITENSGLDELADDVVDHHVGFLDAR